VTRDWLGLLAAVRFPLAVLLSYSLGHGLIAYENHNREKRQREDDEFFLKAVAEGRCTREYSDGSNPIGPEPKVIVKIPGLYQVCRS
jgi:hypothetical protein